jgi:hypothetical protein
MKLGPTVAALALIAASASMSTSALSQGKEPPKARTAPSHSFMKSASSATTNKARVMSFASKAAPRIQSMPRAAKGANPSAK